MATLDNPGAWVRRVLVNKHRSKLRRLTTEAKALVGLKNQVETTVIEPELDELFSFVRQLPTRQAQVVALRYWDDLSLAQIAEVLGCGTESVRTHLKRGRSTLRRLLEDHDHPLATARNGDNLSAAVGQLGNKSFDQAVGQVHDRHSTPPDPARSSRGRVASIVLLFLVALAVFRFLDDPAARTDTVDEPEIGESIDNEGDEQGAVEGDGLVPFTVGAGPASAVVPLNDGTPDWNADESLLLLYQQGLGHLVVDGSSGEVLAEPALDAIDIEDLVWHPTEPNQILALQPDGIVTYNALDGSVLQRIAVEGCSTLLAPNHLSSMVTETGTIGLRCETGTGVDLVLADLVSGQILARMSAPADAAAPVPSPSGEWVLVSVGDNEVIVFDSGLVEQRRFVWSQAVIVTEAQGREVVVGPNYASTGTTGTGSLIVVDLASGDITEIVGPSTGEPRSLTAVVVAASENGIVALGAGTDDAGATYQGPLTPGWLHIVDLNELTPTPAAVVERGVLANDGLVAWDRWHVGISANGDRIVYAAAVGDALEATVLPLD